MRLAVLCFRSMIENMLVHVLYRPEKTSRFVPRISQKISERRKYAQLQVIKEGAKIPEVREATIEQAERKKDKNRKNPYLHLIRFLTRSDELPN